MPRRCRGCRPAWLAALLALSLGGAAAHALPYGANAHIPPSTLLDAAHETRVAWVRIDLNWDLVEREPGTYDWSTFDQLVDTAEALGLRIYATLAYTPAWATQGPPGSGVPSDPARWYEFCFRAAQRYRGRVEHFGMWNEPNVSSFWAGSRSQYIEVILKTGSRAVHTANPRARVCGPELAHLESADWDSWLGDVLSRAAADLDVVTHHVYPSNCDSGSVLKALTEDRKYPWEPLSVRDVLREAGWRPRPFWLTETGCNSRSPDAAGEERQARFVSSLLRDVLAPTRSLTWVHKVFFYELSDDPRFPATWGLLGPPPEYPAKPAAAAHRTFASSNEVDDGEVTRASFPAVLRPGERVTVSLTMHNTGTTSWSRDAGYSLQAVSSNAFAPARHDLEPNEVVPPGGVTTFTFDLEAPVNIPFGGGEYETGWQLVRQGRWSFGEVCRRTVAVTGGHDVRQVQIVPAMANTAGLNGTTWRSDLTLYNAGPEPAEVSIALLLQGQDNTNARTAPFTVEPGSQRRIPDVLAELFGVTGSAVLRLDIVRGHLAAVGRSLMTAGPGLVAQHVPSLALESAVPTGQTAHLPGLAYSTQRHRGCRTNLGLFNPTSEPVTARVDLFGDGGAPAGALAFDLQPSGYLLVSDIYRKVASPDVDSGTASVRALTPGGALLTWASVVDNQSGDAALLTPAKVADEPLVVVAAAHTNGLKGAQWRSDLQLLNPSAKQAQLTVSLITPDTVPPRPPTTLTLGAGASALVEDVVTSLFGPSGTGALRIAPRAGTPAAACGTTYTQTASGRLGQAVPAALASDATSFGQVAAILALSSSASATAGSRTNLGLVNLSGRTITVEIDLFASPATPLGGLTVVLPSLAWHQLNNVFHFLAPEVEDGFALVRTTTPSGRFFAWASVVDNASSDSVLVPGW